MINTKANASVRFAFMLIACAVIIIAAVGIISFLNKPNVINGGDVKNFKSIGELTNFLKQSQETDYYNGGFGEAMLRGGDVTTAIAEDSAAPSVAKADGANEAGGSANDYSQTNIQVNGVDEPDIVKNDGKYIYLVNDYGNSITISEVYPADNMKIVSEINLSDKENSRYVRNIF